MATRTSDWCKRAALLLGLVIGALPAAARADDGVAQARAALPANTRDSGVLKVATSLQWPPFDYKAENGDADGIDIRLVSLLAGRLGLKPQYDDIKFPSIVPGVSSGRYDIGVDQMAITPERQKVVGFLPYYKSGYGLLTRQGVTDVEINHLCGRTLVITQGSAQVAIAQELSGKCEQAGGKPIALTYFPDSAATYLALANGRGDGFLTDRAVGVYIARGNSKLAMTEGILPTEAAISGIVIARDNKPLLEALRLALETAISDGSYKKIMSDFGVPDGALTRDEFLNAVRQ